LRGVNKSTWKELKVPKATEDKFKLATELFLMYNSMKYVCLNLSIKDRRNIWCYDIPIIEESVTNSGETKFNSNLPIMLNAFAKLALWRVRYCCRALLPKRLEQVETKGMSPTSFRGRGAV
jgi:hypothetical protein